MRNNTNLKSVRAAKWLSIFIVMLAVVTFFGSTISVSASSGAQQISGSGAAAQPGECIDPEGAGADFSLALEGDLDGCLYIFVATYQCSEGGVYNETGTELFVGTGLEGAGGTFMTSYRFVGKFQDCANLAGQIHGRCQHPLIAGSGTGEFEGLTGRLDFKDDVDAGVVYYRGHFK